ncbi:hypothetical protein JCM3774_006210 [Rhodotorula dairenensis]
MYATPDQHRRRPPPAPPAGSPFAGAGGHSPSASRLALALGRAPGTSVARVLDAERALAPAPVPSPRKIRHKAWTTKYLVDKPANALLSLETSCRLVSFDSAGYPLAAALNLVHLVVRLPAFYPALPAASRYHARTADARLEALQRLNRTSWATSAWWLSCALVLLSIANAAYLASRRRKYQMVLRRDPLSSPNAKSTLLNFAPTRTRDHAGRAARLRRALLKLVGWSKPEQDAAATTTTFPVQELNVWVPDHALWSLRLFTLYSPPVAVMYHLLSPTNFLPMLICGALFTAQIFAVVYLYSTLVSDRAALQAEVMHEYNAKFVNPRVFVPKRDAAVSTSEAEMVSKRDWRGSQRDSGNGAASRSSWLSARPLRGTLASEAGQDGAQEEEEEEEEQVLQRGSGRKAVPRRRRHSEMPLRRAVLDHRDDDDDDDEDHRAGGSTSPASSTSMLSASRRKRHAPRASMLG